MLESDVFDEEGFSEGILSFYQLDVVEPVVGKFVFLVDQDLVGILDGEFAFQGG